MQRNPNIRFKTVNAYERANGKEMKSDLKVIGHIFLGVPLNGQVNMNTYSDGYLYTYHSPCGYSCRYHKPLERQVSCYTS
jgi:hypothetical protein